MQKAVKSFEPLYIQQALKKDDQMFHLRQEYKFIIPLSYLDEVLFFLKDDFFCKYCDDGFVFKYQNTYFDTANYDFFHKHRQGKYNRLKVRIREYKNGIPNRYIECKEKIRGQKNKKKRQLLDHDSNHANSLSCDFLEEIVRKHDYIVEQLKVSAQIAYDRWHFIAKVGDFRLTMDFDLQVNLPNNQGVQLMPGYFVLELKSNQFPKKIIQFLRRNLKIRETSFSKYCVALCYLQPSLKRNRWKSIFKNYF